MSGDRRKVDWITVSNLIKQSYINMQPVHLNDPLSDEQKAEENPSDYTKLATARLLLDVINGYITFDTLPYYYDPADLTIAVAVILIKFEALGIDIPETVHKFLMAAYIDSIKNGQGAL